jgi:hypothetical protein
MFVCSLYLFGYILNSEITMPFDSKSFDCMAL